MYQAKKPEHLLTTSDSHHSIGVTVSILFKSSIAVAVVVNHHSPMDTAAEGKGKVTTRRQKRKMNENPTSTTPKKRIHKPVKSPSKPPVESPSLERSRRNEKRSRSRAGTGSGNRGTLGQDQPSAATNELENMSHEEQRLLEKLLKKKRISIRALPSPEVPPTEEYNEDGENNYQDVDDEHDESGSDEESRDSSKNKENNNHAHASGVDGQSDDELSIKFGNRSSHASDTEQLEECQEEEKEDRDKDEVVIPGDEEDEECLGGSSPNLLGQEGRQTGLKIDDSVIMNFLSSIKGSIKKTVEESVGNAVTDIKRDLQDVHKLRDEVGHLNTIMTTTATALFVKQASTQPRMKEIQRRLCLLPALFTEQFLSIILSRCFVGFCLNELDLGGYSVQELKGVHLLSVMYFSKKPGEKKQEKYDSHIGRSFSKFRHGILLSAFLAMQKNAFKTFASETVHKAFSAGATDDSPEVEAGKSILFPAVRETSTTGGGISSLSQPFWLQPGFIGSEHCESAACKSEKRNGPEVADVRAFEGSQLNEDNESTDRIDSNQSSLKMKMSKNSPITDDEIAIEAANMVYKCITTVLYNGRKTSKVQLFHDFLYLFTGWSQFKNSVDQKSLKLRWENPNNRSVHYLEQLGSMNIVPPQHRFSHMDSNGEQKDLDNCRILKSFINEHPELTLKIEHDIIVDGSTRRLTYRRSLIEVVAKLISSFTFQESNSQAKFVLGVEKKGLKVISVMAIGLRKLVDGAIAEMNRTGTVMWAETVCAKAKGGRAKKSRRTTSNPSATDDIGRSAQYQFPLINDFSINELLPPPSKQQELLSNMILTLTKEEYAAKNEGHNETPDGRTTTDLSRDNNNVIQASAENGVFCFN